MRMVPAGHLFIFFPFATPLDYDQGDVVMLGCTAGERSYFLEQPVQEKVGRWRGASGTFLQAAEPEELAPFVDRLDQAVAVQQKYVPRLQGEFPVLVGQILHGAQGEPGHLEIGKVAGGRPYQERA